MSLDSAGFKHRTRPPALSSSSSSSSTASASGAPGGAGGGPQTGGVFARRGTPAAGREGHDRCLEELEKERYYRASVSVLSCPNSAKTDYIVITLTHSTVRIIKSTRSSRTVAQLLTVSS